MVTRCPSCGTVFRVTPDQLQVHHGQVRCGRCATIFNAFETLASRAAPAAEQEPEAATSPVGPPDIAIAAKAQRKNAPPPDEAILPPPPPGRRVPELLDDYVDETERRSVLWVFGALLLIVALGGQAAYFYRTDLASIYPQSKPWLQTYCEILQCTVPLPQKPELLSIEASDLQADSARPGVITLSATLRNCARFAQDYPALELTLTNVNDKPVARKLIYPSEYLGTNADAKQGIGANSEYLLKLDLDIDGLTAAGYRLGGSGLTALPCPNKP